MKCKTENFVQLCSNNGKRRSSLIETVYMYDSNKMSNVRGRSIYKDHLNLVRSEDDSKRSTEVGGGLGGGGLMVGGYRVLGHREDTGGLVVAR